MSSPDAFGKVAVLMGESEVDEAQLRPGERAASEMAPRNESEVDEAQLRPGERAASEMAPRNASEVDEARLRPGERPATCGRAGTARSGGLWA